MAGGMGVQAHGLLDKVLGHHLRALFVDSGHVDIALGDVVAGVPDRHLVMLDGKLPDLLAAGFALLDQLDQRMATDVELIGDSLNRIPERLCVHSLPLLSNEKRQVVDDLVIIHQQDFF